MSSMSFVIYLTADFEAFDIVSQCSDVIVFERSSEEA